MFCLLFALTSDFPVFVLASRNNVVVQLCPYVSLTCLFTSLLLKTIWVNGTFVFCMRWSVTCTEVLVTWSADKITIPLSHIVSASCHVSASMGTRGMGWEQRCEASTSTERECSHVSRKTDGRCRVAMNEQCLLSQRIFTVVALWIKYLSACLRI